MDPVQVLEAESRGAFTGDAGLVIERFERAARARPDAIAVDVITDCDGTFEHQVSNRRLNAIANRVAALLRGHGIGAEHIVGVAADHDLATVAAILGVMKSGACFLPLDASMPRARVTRIRKESRLSAIVVTAASRGRYESSGAALIAIDECLTGGSASGVSGASASGPASVSARDVASTLDGANAAYVIYTSGSTGEPKGVVVTQAGLANHGASVTGILGLTADDRMLQFCSLAFDAAYEEIFPTLCRGGRLVVRSASMGHDISAFLQRCEERGVTIIDVPTAFWMVLTRILRGDHRRLPESIRWIIIGGEAAAAEDVAYWAEHYQNRLHLLNSYGPTEGTIITTSCDLMTRGLAGDEVPLGASLPHTSIILRSHGRLCQPGEIGEMLIAGAGVARGYLNAPRLTADRFVPDPDARSGERVYRTGDLAVRTARGDLLFKGRHDNQIKLNGHRIQLEEVEAALLSHYAIGACAVLPRDNHSGGKQLVAYCILKQNQTSLPFDVTPLSVMDLRAFLRDLLPDYMLPAEFCFLEKFILNAHGKIDRTKLPEIGHFDRKRRRLPDHEYAQPGIETVLARIWCEVLDLDLKELGANDPFEYVGGNSLYSIQIRYKAQQAGVLFKAGDMHLKQTIRGLAGTCTASEDIWKRARHALVDYKKYAENLGTVIMRGMREQMDFGRRRKERQLRHIVGRFHAGLADKNDIIYIFVTPHLLHWLWMTMRFVPAHVNVALIGAAMTSDEVAWIRQRIDRPFLHLDEEVSLGEIQDALFAVNTRNFGWLDPDCFVLNPGLFTEMRQLAPDEAINCMWTHAACGPTKRPFHVLESYFLFFNIAAIEKLRREGIMPRPSAVHATMAQARAVRTLIPVDEGQRDNYSSAFAHRLFSFDFAPFILFQLVANARGFKLNRVRFFTEIDTFNPYNYFSDEAIHVFPTIRNFARNDPASGDQQHRLMADLLLMTSMRHELPSSYEPRRQFIEERLRAGIGVIPIEEMKSMIVMYLAERGVTNKTFSREEFGWIVPERMHARRVPLDGLMV